MNKRTPLSQNSIQSVESCAYRCAVIAGSWHNIDIIESALPNNAPIHDAIERNTSRKYKMVSLGFVPKVMAYL